MTALPRLLTFAPMVDSEVFRLLFAHYDIPYEEEPHAFVWAPVLALVRVGSLQIPALYGAGMRVVDPGTVIERWDAAQPPGHALIPTDPARSATARRDWATFHGPLADSTARLAYYHLLPHRSLMIEPFTRGLPRGEVAAARWIYPLQRAVLSMALWLSEVSAKQSLDRIRAIFDLTASRVADGRPYLQGDRVTLGDVALAAAAGAVTLPEGNMSPQPPLVDMPPEYAAIVRELQAHPTAEFVQRLYRSGAFARSTAT